MDTCPKCGLLVAFSWDDGDRPPPDTPTCNPLRSPDCWRVIGKTTQPDAFGRKRMLRLADRDPSAGSGDHERDQGDDHG